MKQKSIKKETLMNNLMSFLIFTVLYQDKTSQLFIKVNIHLKKTQKINKKLLIKIFPIFQPQKILINSNLKTLFYKDTMKIYLYFKEIKMIWENYVVKVEWLKKFHQKEKSKNLTKFNKPKNTLNNLALLIHYKFSKEEGQNHWNYNKKPKVILIVIM